MFCVRRTVFRSMLRRTIFLLSLMTFALVASAAEGEPTHGKRHHVKASRSSAGVKAKVVRKVSATKHKQLIRAEAVPLKP